VGIIANSLMKAGIAITIGQRQFAWKTVLPLVAMAATGAAMLLLA
jgi:uncharacterized membrane protein (DUF4010 family)